MTTGADDEQTIVDVIPQVALPMGCATLSMCFSSGPKYLFTGGEDGYIRMFNIPASLKGENPLTAAQRHSIMDTIHCGGVLEGFWENEVPRPAAGPGTTYVPDVSPVESLVCDDEGVFVVAGQRDGGICVMSSRHSYGHPVWYFRSAKNKSAYQREHHSDKVSCLIKSGMDLVSGSWDQTCVLWDMDTGRARARFACNGQVSSLEWRPQGAEHVELSAAAQAPACEDDDDNDSLFGSDNEDAAAAAAAAIGCDAVFMSTTVNGSVAVWDARQAQPATKLDSGSVWTMSGCWAGDGMSVYVGGRKGQVRQIDLRTNTVRTALQLPQASGTVGCLRRVGKRYLLLGAEDNVRLYDTRSSAKVPYSTIPGSGSGAGGSGGFGGGFGGGSLVSRGDFFTVASHELSTVYEIVTATSREKNR